MKAFNLNKQAKHDYTTTEKMLNQYNKDNNNKSPDMITDMTLGENGRKNADNTVPLDTQISKVMPPVKQDVILESHLNKDKKGMNDKRLGIWDTDVSTYALLSEAYDQRKLRAFNDVNKEKRDTSFWDKYVGQQLDGEKTTIVSNRQNSQLENNPKRFDGISTKGNIVENVKKFVTKQDFDKMVSASVKDADSMLFHIYANSFSESRELTNKEKQIIKDINAGKLRKFCQKAKWMDISDLSFEGLAGEKPQEEPWQETPVEYDDITIRQENGQVVVYEDDIPIDKYPSVREAKDNYPEAKIV